MSIRPRICVVSGRYPVTEFESYVNHKAYCLVHGYDYICCSWPTGSSNPYMNKIRYLQSYLDLFDYIFWIDDDAFFIDFGRTLESIAPVGDAFMSVCSSPGFKELKTMISSGQFMIKRGTTASDFLSSVESTDLAKVKAWWRPDHGYFTNGDQDAMVYLMENDPRFSRIDIHPGEVFNSRIDELIEGKNVFVLHLTGTMTKKRRALRGAKKYLGRDGTLLPPEYRDALFVHRPRRGLLRRLLSKFRSYARALS